jgi:hypothetical protein
MHLRQWFMTVAALVLLAAGVAAFFYFRSIYIAEFQEPETYTCATGETIIARFGKDVLYVELPGRLPAILRMTQFSGEQGATFTNDRRGITAMSKDFTLSVSEDGTQTYEACATSAPEADVGSAVGIYENAHGTYRVAVPQGWYAYPLSLTQVIFTPSESFTLPEGTEGYAIGDQMTIREASYAEIIGAGTPDEYLRGIGLTEESEFFVERQDVTRAGHAMTRGVLNAAAADGRTLLYVLFPESGGPLVFSHYPYVAGSASAQAFEALVNSFTPLYGI